MNLENTRLSEISQIINIMKYLEYFIEVFIPN